GTSATAWNYGAGTSAANLSALSIADFTTPMPDDNLFNGTGTNAERLALTTDGSPSDYAAIFGDSGGGNWFDVSGSGLSQIGYVRLNGEANDPADGGVRLDAVFANADAVPEPASFALLAVGATVLATRRRVP
ncbi:MAG TPA: PEP-CTERM sorting domain-containing protein, partial [Tepidisphaeraceae bacterium]|nr:PEP-CTERM sorting domain-containing protein [Tepidisphaeraceae bacterium]